MKNRKIAYLYLTIAFCLWGSLYVVSKFVLGKIPPFTVSFIRYLISGIILLFLLKMNKPKK
ncbi:EamA family transporter [Clostridium tyrobutyricum]|uniref:EamA family transporter n=1 Tax=Clostridium tyrobutyricum TaxID=1519 RepID=UPI0020CD6837|nr:EamA family transporter [Clostridium tyrobutyricum]